jgi:hypothetical protein
LLQKKTQCHDCCSVLVTQYPSSSRLEAAKKIERELNETAEADKTAKAAAESERQEAERRKVFKGPMIQAFFALPTLASRDNLSVSVSGFPVTGDGGAVTVPASAPADICYTSKVPPYGITTSSVTTCASFNLRNGENHIPLTYVVIKQSVLTSDCSLKDGYANTNKLTEGEDGGVFVMPGRYVVACGFFTTRPQADPVTESASTRFTSKPLVLGIDARPEGGRAELIFEYDGASVSGQVRSTPFFPRVR